MFIKLIHFLIYPRWISKYILTDIARWWKDYGSENINDFYCCSGFDHFGQVGCGCYGASIKEYMIFEIKQNWIISKFIVDKHEEWL